jgi:predicted Fe-Mo cluster-binding NifX family protein
MELLIAFGTDDGENFNNDHFGMAKYYYIYNFCDEKQKFVERRENVKFKGDESMKHGDPQKAKATSDVLQDVDVLVGKKFGPNLPRILKKFVCVVLRRKTISDALKLINQNLDNIIQEKNKTINRKHIVIR